MTNIKNIGKELLGKSLNSFHRKTGLTQLEKNNEMQDGILNGILSQVDDAYIEKTEQSNVIHLDGSGDGVVVVDNIEGNTMVNLFKQVMTPSVSKSNESEVITIKEEEDYFVISGTNLTNDKYTYGAVSWGGLYTEHIKNNTLYTLIPIVPLTSVTRHTLRDNTVPSNILINRDLTFTTVSDTNKFVYYVYYDKKEGETSFTFKYPKKFLFLEGDWRNRETNYFTGLQSSFEEKANDEGKYEIEILMKGSNQFDYTKKPSSVSPNGGGYANYDDQLIYLDRTKDYWFEYETSTQKNVLTYFQCYDINKKPIYINYNTNTPNKRIVNYSNTQVFHRDTVYISLKFRDTSDTTAEYLNTMITKCHFGIDTPNDRGIKKPKQNKIKLLINEPLRAIDDLKDKLCVKDGKLVIERNCDKVVLDGKTETWGTFVNSNEDTNKLAVYTTYSITNLPAINRHPKILSNIRTCNGYTQDYVAVGINGWTGKRLYMSSICETLTEFKQWLSENPVTVVYELATPTYEEVLNEYGEPIILEGYENGTLYIDSTIVPTTIVRYTPKMESFKAIKEVKSNNSLLSNDINESIIPYMMEVDMLIMEKEMSLFSSLNKNIRKMEVLDMTSMQKRTGEMLTRLIKGKTLTKEEAQTRVTVYLNAAKITDEQAEELMLLIDEVYA